MAQKKKIKRWKARPSAAPKQKNPSRNKVNTTYDVYGREPRRRSDNASELSKREKEHLAHRKEMQKRAAAVRQKDEVYPAEKKKQRETERIKRKKRKSRMNLALFITAFLVIGITVCVFIFFKVTKIEVEGVNKYSASEIISASGIELGDNLFLSGTAGTAKKIEHEKPYITGVTFKHKLPGTLVIAVKESPASLCFESGGKFVMTDDNRKVLEISDSPVPTAALVTGASLKDPVVSEIAEYEKAETGKYADELIRELHSAKLNKITALDVSDSISLTAVYEGRLTLEFGQAENISYKVKLAVETINDLGAEEHGTINLKFATDNGAAYYRADEEYEK